MTSDPQVAPAEASAAQQGGPHRRGRWVALGVVLAVAGAAAAAVLLMRDDNRASDFTVEASSAADGTDPNDLMRAARDTGQPEAIPVAAIADGDPAGEVPDWSTGDVTWRSTGPAAGTWLRVTWSSPTQVSHIRMDGAGGPTHAYQAAVIQFDDGSSVWVTPDARGNVAADIAPRVVSSATIRFTDGVNGSRAVALRALDLTDRGALATPRAGTPVASTGSGDAALALVDGDLAEGDIGRSWAADTGDSTPWVGIEYDEPVAIATVQIAGASDRPDPVRGSLVFSDGSSIIVSGITSGDDPLTTIAFPPRTVQWVRLDITEGAPVIGEFLVVEAAQTPHQWPAERGLVAQPAAAGTCDATTQAIGNAPASELALVCPATGSSVDGEAVVVIATEPGAPVTALASSPGTSAIETVATATADAQGRAVLVLDTAQLRAGPMALRVVSPDASRPLYVQLFNAAGVDDEGAQYVPAGLTLRYEDDFSSPVSISHDGIDARYAATKPAGGGGSEFGEAVFADPAWGTDTYGTLDDDYLRIRVQELTGVDDPTGWERPHLGGLVSSARIGASGFSAQYGYFEARMLAPAGTGSWPAFWMLDTEAARDPSQGQGEVDAVELYGHNPIGACHTIHNWGPGDDHDADGRCLDDHELGDWALMWHTYGVQIRPDGADMFIDGVPVASLDGLERHDLPYFFMVNMALGGGWPVDLGPTGGELELYVDWVRVYT